MRYAKPYSKLYCNKIFYVPLRLHNSLRGKIGVDHPRARLFGGCLSSRELPLEGLSHDLADALALAGTRRLHDGTAVQPYIA